MRASSRNHWDDVALEWQQAHPQRLWRAHSDAVNLHLCERWCAGAPPDRVLKTDLFDEAFGTGLIGVAASQASFVAGVDRSLHTARAARTRLAHGYACAADVRALPFEAGAFDLVISTSTLDHFAQAGDIPIALGEIWRVLAPGGRLILTLDNAANPVVALRNALPFSWLNRAGLVPYYVGATHGPWAGARQLRAAGFDLIERTAVMHCPRVPGVLAARFGERLASSAVARMFLRLCAGFERLEKWPTRFVTGYYVGFLARKSGNRVS